MRHLLSILAKDPLLGEMILILEIKRDFVHVWVCWLGEIRDVDEVEGQCLGVTRRHIGTHARLVAEFTVMSEHQAALVDMVHRRHHRLLRLRHRFHETRAAASPLIRRGYRLPFRVFALPFANERGQGSEVGSGRVISLRPLERYRISLAEDGQLMVDMSVVYRFERGDWDRPGAFLQT